MTRSPISRVSKGRARELAKYRKQSRKYLEEHPVCSYPGCREPATEVHHAGGRNGWRLLFKPWWNSACRPHHDLAKSDPTHSRKIGWIIYRVVQLQPPEAVAPWT